MTTRTEGTHAILGKKCLDVLQVLLIRNVSALKRKQKEPCIYSGGHRDFERQSVLRRLRLPEAEYLTYPITPAQICNIAPPLVDIRGLQGNVNPTPPSLITTWYTSPMTIAVLTSPGGSELVRGVGKRENDDPLPLNFLSICR